MPVWSVDRNEATCLYIMLGNGRRYESIRGKVARGIVSLVGFLISISGIITLVGPIGIIPWGPHWSYCVRVSAQMHMGLHLF